MEFDAPFSNIRNCAGRAERKCEIRQRISGTNDIEPLQGGKTDDGEQRSFWEIKADLARQKRNSFFLAGGQQDIEAAFGETHRMEEVLECMVAPFAPERAHKNQSGGSMVDCFGGRDFAIGLV